MHSLFDGFPSSDGELYCVGGVYAGKGDMDVMGRTMAVNMA